MEKNLSNEGKTFEMYEFVLALLGTFAFIGLMGFAGWLDSIS
jgi:hypothetical protein